MVCLAREEWDDFGFRTKFYGTLFGGPVDAGGTPLGAVKILHRDSLVTANAIAGLFPTLGFEALPEDFASLWQDATAYERIRAHLAGAAADFLIRLRDVAADPLHAERFERGGGWATSLVRFPNALEALRRGRELFVGGELESVATSFTYRLRNVRGALTHEVDIDFDPTNPLGRVFVLVGANGTGKTSLLSSLADRLSGRSDRAGSRGETVPADVAYSVLAISYSAFDRFERPNRGMVAAYRYSGLRDRVDRPHRIDVDGRIGELILHLRSAAPALRTQIRAALVGLEILPAEEEDWTQGEFETFADRMGTWSAGHQIVALIVSHAILWTRKRTLLLFDEPELHLHPTLLSSLLRTLGKILAEQDAFCIVATHSPIPLQEVPTRFVRILERVGTMVHAAKLPEQTFGAELGELVDRVFRFGPESRNFRTEVDDLLGTDGGVAKVRLALGGKLSLAVRALLEGEVEPEVEADA